MAFDAAAALAPAVAPNMPDYERARREFSWDAARAALDGLPGGRGLNIAHEAVDRHVRAGRGGRVALRCLAVSGGRQEITFAALARATNRFANLLGRLGVNPGDRVFACLGRVPELVIAALGTLKARAVFAPLFSAFGPEPLRARVAIGRPKVLVTAQSLYRQKVAAIRGDLAGLEHVILVRDEPEELPAGTLDFHAALRESSRAFEIGPTAPEDAALLHFTSGTTGRPKAAVHVHEAVVAHHATGLMALDLHPDDVFWCTADPGWVTGTSDVRRDEHPRRGRLRRRTLVSDRGRRGRERVVHRAHGDPDDDAARRRGRPTARHPPAAVSGQRRRAARSRGRGLG
jgi:acetyl-CoA synthetase